MVSIEYISMRKDYGGVEISSQKKDTFMNITKSLFACFVAVCVCIAQTNVTISGKVTDSSGVTPISGAVVQLEKGGLTSTTGADGSFLLSGSVDIINSQFNKPLSDKITVSLYRGYLNLNIREKSKIAITTYTIQGKALSSIRKTMDAGFHSVALPPMSSGVYFYRIQSGEDEFVIKNNSLTCVSGGVELSSQNQSSTALTRQVKSYVPINDVIAATKTGYLDYRVEIKESDTSGIEIRMISQDTGTVTDIDGNVYHAIKLGNQVWTVENLRTTRYKDGTAIPYVTDKSAWANLTTSGYCYYENDSTANAVKYGALYNWHTVNTGKLAPAGWHVPTNAEWDTLQNYLIANGYNWDGTTTGNKIGKSMAAKTDWALSSVQGDVGNDLPSNNSSGFSALPGGSRYNDGSFSGQGKDGGWWSATEDDASTSYNSLLGYSNEPLYRAIHNKEYGFSVRLVRD